MLSKCPKCEKAFTYANVKAIDAKDGRLSWKAVSYNCPFCQTSLSVGIDPIAIKTETVSEIIKALGKR